jgi:hypothetical protein
MPWRKQQHAHWLQCSFPFAVELFVDCQDFIAGGE